MINCNKCGKPWDGHATACEPIKRYVMIGNAWTSQEHANGMWMLYHNHLAAIESARAEAFRMGQEEMRDRAAEFVNGHLSKDIRALPLKDKP